MCIGLLCFRQNIAGAHADQKHRDYYQYYYAVLRGSGTDAPQLLFQKLLVTSGHFRILLLAIGDDSLRQRAPLRVRVRVRRLGNPGYQFAEAATKLSIKDAFDAVRALTH
jgi:hypothetical protein